MTIEIRISSIVRNLKYKSHLESAATEADIERRYLVEAGSEKMSELNICIDEALAMARLQCSRFLKSYSLDGDAVTIEFEESARRFDYRDTQIEHLLTSLIVDYALMKYYVSVGKYDMSKAREQMATLALQSLQTSLYEKRPPQPIKTV